MALAMTANARLAVVEAQASVRSDFPMPQPLLPSYSAPQKDAKQLRDQLQFTQVLDNPCETQGASTRCSSEGQSVSPAATDCPPSPRDRSCSNEDPDIDQTWNTQALACGRSAQSPSQDEGPTGPTSQGLPAPEESRDAMPSSVASVEQRRAGERLSETLAPAGVEVGCVQHQLELSHILARSRTQAGCRLVQSEIGSATKQRLDDIADQFRGHLWELAKCTKGNYVLQKLIFHAAPHILQWMVEELSDVAEQLARSKYGCRVFLRLLEHCSSAQMRPLVELLLHCADCHHVLTLCKGQFSNYVIQSILERGSRAQQQWIGSIVAMYIQQLCTHSHGASVVHQVLVHCSDQERLVLNLNLHALFASDEWWLMSMAKHRHGHESLEQMQQLGLPDLSNILCHLSQPRYMRILAATKRSKEAREGNSGA